MKELAEKGQLEGRKVNHSTRKTFAQILVQAGRPPTEIAHLGGWKNLQTLNVFSTPTLEQQAQASDILSDHMRPSSRNDFVTQCHVQTIEHKNTSVLADIKPIMNTNYTCNTLDASRSVSSNVSKQHSNPFAVLCGAYISGGTFNINFVSGKRKFSDVGSSQESQ
ncbi:uncharacterized protein LOC132745448 isoform X1 [Ruditapes philippinarum]|uniref:uncharacterized protein LOC132745448 isoform X1 n=1 Tax=Ruditapes philippinarum TaxID=129788 RepID=UPI00295C09BB|nr:uncharacterized protein LOC132745448 isoform X1 [Ruditapes philippinarum]